MRLPTGMRIGLGHQVNSKILKTLRIPVPEAVLSHMKLRSDCGCSSYRSGYLPQSDCLADDLGLINLNPIIKHKDTNGSRDEVISMNQSIGKKFFPDNFRNLHLSGRIDPLPHLFSSKISQYEPLLSYVEGGSGLGLSQSQAADTTARPFQNLGVHSETPTCFSQIRHLELLHPKRPSKINYLC